MVLTFMHTYICILILFLSGVAAAAGPDAGQARELPPRRRPGVGPRQAHDHRRKDLQAGKPGQTCLPTE